MCAPTTLNDLDEKLEILGQLPALNIYTQICFCFSFPKTSSRPETVETLTKGLERLSASFPWVAGQVVNEGSSEGNTGIFKIVAFEKIPPLIVKDLSADTSAPTMAALRQSDFPFSMLDESIICPRSTLPGVFNTAVSDVLPVLLLQATFITGGLILSVLGQHQVMDGAGQGQILDLLSKACRNEPFTSEELSTGNLKRHNLIPLLEDTWKPGSELANQTVKPPPADLPPAPPTCRWAYFNFEAGSLATLKSEASKVLSSGYISTDDALCALIWQSVTRARLAHLDTEAETVFARAVNVRRYLGVPQTYPGMIQNMAFSKSTIQTLVNAPLGSVAAQLRSAINPSGLAHQTRAMATVLDRSPDKNIINLTASLDLSKDIMLSSWAKMDCYHLAFNLGLGKPEAVRRPQFTPLESLMYLMPKTEEGNIALAICLGEDDVKRLREDNEFINYGSYIA